MDRTLSREQLLRDGEPVVVREQSIAGDAFAREQGLLKIGLAQDRVRGVTGFRGVPVAEHVDRVAAICLRQRGP